MATSVGPNRTVVLVDDDVERVQGVEQLCPQTSCYFRPPTLVTAEWAATLGPVDLVIWDWSKLPGGEPRRVARGLQQQRPNLPMLHLNPNLSDEGMREIATGPSSDFVRSPVDLSEMSHRIKRLLISSADAAPDLRPKPAETAPHPTGSGRTEHVAFDLHHPESGRLDARRIGELFGMPLRRVAALLGRNAQTVAKTPDAPTIQPGLALFERIATALLSLVGSEAALRIWLNAENPQLDRQTPMEWILQGEGLVVAELLESQLGGQPG